MDYNLEKMFICENSIKNLHVIDYFLLFWIL